MSGNAGSDIANLPHLIEAFGQDPARGEVPLRVARLGVAEALAALDGSGIDSIPPALGAAVQQLLACGLTGTPNDGAEQAFLAGRDLSRPPQLLAAMVLAAGFRLQGRPALGAVPAGMRPFYGRYLLTMPPLFDAPGEADHYAAYLQQVVSEFHVLTVAIPQDSQAAALARLFTVAFLAVPAYFSRHDLSATMRQRGAILAFDRRARGGADAPLPDRAARDDGKLRVGVVMPAFVSRTETFFSIAHVAGLDRSRFDVRLYAERWEDSAMEAYCRDCAEGFTVLPSGDPAEQAAAIRADGLDMLLFGSNIAAGGNPQTLLALHRMAPVQVALATCPATTGLATVDAFLSSALTEPAGDAAAAQYTETLYRMPGGFNCFDYGPEAPGRPQPLPRAALNATDDSVLYVSGANFHKIVPELEQAWAETLAAVPGSLLVLYPFNPNWSDGYPAWFLVQRMGRSLEAVGLGLDRIRILPPFPERAGVDSLLATADVYLDSFPFSGSGSLADPLRLGVPAVTCDGASQRALQGPSMLRSLGLDDLVAADPRGYVALATALGTDRERRTETRTRLGRAMEAAPFLDGAGFAAKVGTALKEIFRELGDNGR